MRHRKLFFIFTAICAVLLPALAGAYPAEVARTGQTKCYDSTGAVIDCAGTGQDGAIQAGAVWPVPRFIDNKDGTVTDSLTGLEWSKDANPAGKSMTYWQDALDYVKTLNTGGHNDWRLPNVNELESLVNAGAYNPVLPSWKSFTNVQSDFYWSSTPIDAHNIIPHGVWGAWVVGMGSGLVTYVVTAEYIPVGYASSDGKSEGPLFYVWPVRSGQCGSLGNSVICLPKTGPTTCYDDNGTIINCAGTGQDGDIQAGFAWPNPRFADHGDGTVTDNLTGLEWTKDANAGDNMTWQEALDYVKTLNTGGHNDWRLPNRRELRSLADYSKYNPSLPQDYPFTNVQSGSYWSSTSLASSADSAWVVGMYIGPIGGPVVGGVHGGSKSDYGYMWPVRGGQVGNPLISPGACPAQKLLGVDNPQLENLRYFRDCKLAQSAIGRKVIETYYNNADSINAAFKRSPALRAVTRRVLEVISPMVGNN